MTNFEKYKDEILKIIETGCCCIAVKNGKPVKCESMPGCDNCELNTDGESGCAFEFLKWAYEDDGEIKKSMKGCAECAHASKTIHEYPCSECGRSYPDKFELKPKKTRQSEFLKAYPNAKLIDGKVLSVDPCLIDRTYNTEDCIDGYCKLCKEKYWSQEVE